MGTEDFTALELAQEAFPAVGIAATRLAVETKNRVIGKLGAQLQIIALKDITTLSHRQAEIYEGKIEVVLQQVERACMWPKNANPRGYPTLRALARKKANVKNIQQGLKEFAKRTQEFEALLAVLDQVQTIKDLTSEDLGLDISSTSKKDNVPGYPQHVNEALYFTLDLHTSCDCPIQHLKLAKLRLDATEEHDGTKVPFDVIFPASPVHHRASPGREVWHETMVIVSSKRPVQKKRRLPQKSSGIRGMIHTEGRELSCGDFCKYLKAKLGFCLKLNLIYESSDPVLRTDENLAKPVRNVKLVQSLSLAKVLQNLGHKMTTKERFHLGYVLAKSVWQYYGSDWMKNPWTHDDIQFLEEQVTGDNSHGTAISSYNPYFDPNFGKTETFLGEYCPEGMLIQRYPGVLALAIMLIEIVQGQPFGNPDDHQPYNLSKVRTYYKHAWNLVSGTTLDCNIMYKEIIKKCLDGKLFKDAPFDSKDPKNGLEIRRSIIYREVVYPLKHLLSLCGPSSNFDEPILQANHDIGLQEPVAAPWHIPIYQSDHAPMSSPSPLPTSQYLPSAIDASSQPGISVYPENESRSRTVSPELRSYAPDSSSQASMRSSRPTSRDEFEIAIICAVKPEYDAVTLLVDEFFDDEGDMYGRAAEDQNTYLAGRIDKYNVVLALLPGMGKANAAKVAASFRSSYRGIELALLVGICGGVPKNGEGQEIILGDVVISGSIVQYDLGRRFPNEFRRKNTFNENMGRANADVRGFIAMLSTCHVSERLELRTAQHLLKLQKIASERYPGKYDYPGAEEDKLFPPTYRHKHHVSFNCVCCNHCAQVSDPVCEKAMLGAVCSDLLCDDTNLVPRRRLDEKMQCGVDVLKLQQPMLHIGSVASGDTVMRSGEDRDTIAKRDNVIAFEMEGAGVWDNLSCIIIKGVCDYSDCHKNKKWQNFAAATAASAMRAILERYNRRDRSPRPSWERHNFNGR
ncbi:hypothetical protein AA313_de0210118 [Arthrobotrys entomopaga]|nr:hypothetical protein AA313_de0210118 [Arthrobotrys entomopaga]